MRRTKIMVLIILLVCASAAGCSLIKKETQEQEQTKAVAVDTQRVERRDVVSKLVLNGRVKPTQEVIIVPKLPGRVASVNVDLGQRVRKGAVLFTLDERDVRLQLAQAEAALGVAKANLVRAKSSGAEQQLEQLRLAYRGAEAAYDSAKAASDKVKELYTAGAVQRDAVEKAEAQLIAAEQQYTAAKNNLELMENKSIPESVAIAEAQYKQAQAAYNIAKSQLENLSIISPIDGIIASRNVDAGEMVGSAGPAMVIVDASSVTVDINVTESIINRIRQGDKVHIAIPAAGSQSFTGEIINIAPNADARLQSYPVKIGISNADGQLKGGMFAEVEFVFDKASNVLSIPIASVINEQGKKSVFVVNGETAHKKEIKTGLQDEEHFEVVSGLSEGDQVVTKGQDFLQDGAEVVIRKGTKQ